MRIAVGLLVCVLASDPGVACASASASQWERVDVGLQDILFLAVAVVPAVPDVEYE
jgi:hypothetical protein